MIRSSFGFFFLVLLCPIPSNASADLSGKISGSGKCSDGNAELFVSQPETKTLLYQVSVAPQGSFFFKLKEGNYEFRAVNSTGCEARYFFALKPSDKNKKILLTLNEKKGNSKK